MNLLGSKSIVFTTISPEVDIQVLLEPVVTHHKPHACFERNVVKKYERAFKPLLSFSSLITKQNILGPQLTFQMKVLPNFVLVRFLCLQPSTSTRTRFLL